jgi:signal transduction histidine kinase
MSSSSPRPTDFKETEDKLVRESHQLRALLDAIPDTIYFKDAQSRFVLVSRSKWQQALERLPYIRGRRVASGLQAEVPESELLTGLTDFDAYQNDDARVAFEDEQQIIRSGEAMIGKLEKQVFLDKTRRWWLTSKMPWRDGDGAIIGTFGISKDVTALKEAEEKLELMHRQLLDASRHAGMAEVATGVLHNVGNVLNSVNVSATLISDKVRHTKAANVAKLATLFSDHKSDLADFLTADARGKMIPEYLVTLAESLAAEQDTLITELADLRKNIEHIKDIVSMQQSYARTSGVIETISVTEMVEDVLRLNAISLASHDIVTLCDYQARPVITTDRHKVVQILINLLRNAKHSCNDSGRTDKKVTVRVTDDHRHIRIAVVDNGVGIPPENLSRIFNHGFTTRKDGHGFGLHSGALAAKELGGSLTAQSEGPGCGATFILELLHEPVGAVNENLVR